MDNKQTDKNEKPTQQEGQAPPDAATNSAITSTTTPNSTPRQKTDVSEERQPGKGWRWLAIILLFILLLFTGAAGWLGYELYRGAQQAVDVQAREANAAQGAKIEQILKSLDGDRAAQLSAADKITESLNALAREQRAQGDRLAEIAAQDRDRWLVAEIEFLVRLASQRLQTERRPQGALMLLETAQQLLTTLDAAPTIGVREALAGDIAALRMLETVDREGLYARLTALKTIVLTLEALPQAELLSTGRLAAKDEASNGPAKGQSEAPWWRRLWANADAAWSRFLSQHFHVRRRDIPMEAMVSQEQERWLQLDMATNIATAQQALLREEEAIYGAALDNVISHLRSYFPIDKQTQSVLTELDSLRASAIKQPLPDLTTSLQALTEWRKKQQARPTSGVGESP